MEKMEKSGDESCLKRRMIAEDNDYKRYCCQFRKSGGFVVQSCSDMVMDMDSLCLSSSISEMTEPLKKKKKRKKKKKKKEIALRAALRIKFGKFAVDDYNKRKTGFKVTLEFVKVMDLILTGTPGVSVTARLYFHAKEVGVPDNLSSTFEAKVSKDFQKSPKVLNFMKQTRGFEGARTMIPRISKEEEMAWYKMCDEDDIGWDIDHPIEFRPEERRFHYQYGYFVTHRNILPRRFRTPIFRQPEKI